MPPDPTPPRSGAKKRRFPRPFGRYYLERVLSRGGMGEVFLAIVKQLNQRCVIKTIRGDLTGEEEFVGRFADEAKILVRAAHENIIRYFDAGRVASDYYIAMEWVHGRDLGDVLDRAYERGEPMPPEIGLYVTSNLLSGLHYAHELKDEQGRRMGLVHRDISPQNVLIGFDGSVKLIDFGLARTDVLPSRTQGALAVGKYGYMSPEQARHQPLDGRADIYSTGVMLFEVFTGDRLVDEQDQSTLWQRVLNPRHRRPRSVLPSLAPEIDELVMRAVQVRPEERFGSAKAMATYVDRLRGKASSRASLQGYLRHLYPTVDFSAPALPSLENLAEGVEDSIIFATSREGARSVFGRGELPIEGTMQIDARDVLRQIDRRRRLAKEASMRPTQKTEAQAPRIPDDHPTLVSRLPTAASDVVASKATKGPGLGPQFPDDERTVMMTAPPHALFAATAKPATTDPESVIPDEAVFSSEELTSQEATAVRPAPAPPSVEPRRVADPADRPSRAQGYEAPEPALAPLEGPSIVLIGGVVFAVASLALVIVLLVLR